MEEEGEEHNIVRLKRSHSFLLQDPITEHPPFMQVKKMKSSVLHIDKKSKIQITVARTGFQSKSIISLNILLLSSMKAYHRLNQWEGKNLSHKKEVQSRDTTTNGTKNKYSHSRG